MSNFTHFLEGPNGPKIRGRRTKTDFKDRGCYPAVSCHQPVIPVFLKISNSSHNVNKFCNGSQVWTTGVTYLLSASQTRSGKDSHKKMTSSLPITQCSAARNAVCASNPSCQVSNIFKLQKKDPSVPCFQMLSQWNTIIYWTNNIKYQQLIWSQSCTINTNLIQTPTTDLYLTSQLPYVGCPPLTCQCPADHQPAANK